VAREGNATLGPMNGPAKLVVTDATGARRALADLVMAWARDSATGEPRYILELDAAHRGATGGVFLSSETSRRCLPAQLC
jgi:hypothetical protein